MMNRSEARRAAAPSSRCGASGAAGALAGALMAAAIATPLHAVDLQVGSATVIQSIQTGSTTLVGGRTTMIRATVNVSGSAGAVPGVDAMLRIYVDGVEQPNSPTFSINGPINAPLSPQAVTIDHTLNFIALLPVSGDVDLVIEVDPANAIAETNENNNVFTISNLVLQCRDVVDITYVPIDYTPGGAGLPPSVLTDPGIGDGFARAIFAPGTLNYHITPTPPLIWTQNINGSNTSLLNTLQDMRNAQIPALGYPTPDFIYGWLPGNPYSGNGQANGIPGVSAFGNTAPDRFQRTFAHEIGHLVGLSHNSANINTVGVDVEHHLKQTQNLAQTFPTNKKDIMVAGLLTHEAFVNLASFNKWLNDSRVLCPAGDSEGDAGGNDGGALPGSLRVSGEMVHADRSASLDPAFHFEWSAFTPDDPTGDVTIRAFDGAGNERWAVRVDTQRTRESCAGGAMLPATPFYAMVPREVGGVSIESVVVEDGFDGRVLATRERSPGPPVPQITQVVAAGAGEDDPLQAGVAGGAGGGEAAPNAAGADPAVPADPAPADEAFSGRVRIEWTAQDPDGDALLHQLFYSRDEGSSWLPLTMNVAGSSFEFDVSTIPSTLGRHAWFKLRTSDGFGSVDSPVFVSAAMGTGNPPFVHLVTPNPGSVHRQHGPVCLHAAAWDLEDLLLDDAQIAWTSSLDGPLGAGRLFLIDSLSPGDHELVVTGTDSDGMTASKSVAITVLPRTIFGPDLDGDGVVDGADLGILLGAWDTSSNDLDGNGVVDGADLGILLGAWGG